MGKNDASQKVQVKRHSENASEVVRAELRALELDEREHAAKIATLGKAIDEGDASGVAPGDAFSRVRKSLGLRPAGR